MTTTQLTPDVVQCIDEWKNKKGNLIMILHSVQDHYGYVPKDVCFELSRELKIPLARIYEVLTFYNYFSLGTPGKYKVSICLGTACYLKGAPKIIEAIKNELKIEEGQTTEDGLFRLELVRCLGCCGLAPVMTINDKVYGKLKPDEVVSIINKYRQEG